MRFCFIFWGVFHELPCILGRLPFIFGDNILFAFDDINRINYKIYFSWTNII